MNKLLALLYIFTALPAFAGDLLEAELEKVRPTQAVVGLQWVGHKAEKFEGMSNRDLKQRLRAEAPPAVVGPGGVIYILDHHHEFRALLEIGVDKALVEVIKDMSDWTFKEFEKYMIEKGWGYYGDSEGKLVYTLATLPTRLRDMKNDSHRTLASLLRRAGGFVKNGDTHIEFAWANALRPMVSAQMIARNPDRAVEMALDFALSPEAKKLPGFEASKSRRCELRLEYFESP